MSDLLQPAEAHIPPASTPTPANLLPAAVDELGNAVPHPAAGGATVADDPTTTDLDAAAVAGLPRGDWTRIDDPAAAVSRRAARTAKAIGAVLVVMLFAPLLVMLVGMLKSLGG